KIFFLFAVTFLYCSGCGKSEKEGLCPNPVDGSARTIFNVFVANADELAPFPTQLKTVPDDSTPTGARLDYKRTVFADALNTMDGFGLYGGMLVPLSAPVRGSSLPATPELSTAPGASVFLLDLTMLEGSGGASADELKIPVETTSVADQTAIFLHGATRNAIGVRPLRPLKPKNKYGLVVTSCVLDAEGNAIGAAESLKKIIEDGTSETKNPSAQDDLNAMVAFLLEQGYVKNDLAMATTFTTLSPTEDMLSGREAIHDGDAPQPQIDDVYDAVDEEGNLHPLLLERMPGAAEQLDQLPLEDYRFDRMGKIVFGTFPAASFMNDRDLFERDGSSGKLAATGTEDLEFILVLPKEDPEAGIGPPYHTLVYQHAMGVCKETALVIGDSMASANIAIIGIDAVFHGSRSAANPGECTIDPMEFFTPENFAVTSARFRQTALDLVSLVRMLKEGDGIDVLPYPDGDGETDLLTDKLSFSGMSMGASMGMLFLSIEPEIGSAVLNVAGGAIYSMLLYTTAGEPGQPMPFNEYDLHGLSLMSVFQTIADVADPVNFAPFLIEEQLEGFEHDLSVLYQQATRDQSVSLEAYGILSGQMGLPLVGPVLHDYESLERFDTPVSGHISDGVTAGLFQFGPPAPHEMLLICEDDCLEVMLANHAQMRIFHQSFFEDGLSVIIDPWDEDQVSLYE
ncbi:MAG: hypothetical protein ABIJ56_18600, partial [Pseudomonadota bacterium]